MQLERSKEQPSKTLDEFYGESATSENEGSRESGRAMLELIARLRALPDQRRVWGLTSHYRLCFLAHDAFPSPWYVIVGALNRRNYFIEYLMPAALAPWPNAYVRGEARSEDEAVHMILKAMDCSGGWIE